MFQWQFQCVSIVKKQPVDNWVFDQIPEISNAASTNSAGVRSKSASNEPHPTQNLTSPSFPRRNQGEKCPIHLTSNEEEVVAREQAEHVNLQNAVSNKPLFYKRND